MKHRQFKMNSTNWPVPNVLVFIAQLVERFSANTETMSLNPVEVAKFFFWVNLQVLKIQITTATITAVHIIIL